MTTRPHDALFKAAFQTPAHAMGLFQAVLPAEICTAIDWTSLTAEPGSFIDHKLADFHSDLLFSVQLAGRPALLYLLLEHQSTVARDMPLRMNEYLSQIWRRSMREARQSEPQGFGLPLPLVLPVLVSHVSTGWTAARSLHELVDPRPESIPGLAKLVPNFSMLVVDLATLDDAELRGWAIEAFPMLALVFLRDVDRVREDFLRWRDVFLAVLLSPNGAEAVARVLRYVALMSSEMQFEEFRETIQTQLPEVGEIAMTIAEELIQRGRQSERTELLAKLLTSKFGELPTSLVTRLAQASYEQLESIISRVLTVESVDELFAD